MLLLVTCWSTQPSFVLLRFWAGLTPKIANKNIQWRTVPSTISLYELCSVRVKKTVQKLLGFFASPIQRGFQTWKHLEMFPQGSQGSCKTWKVVEFYKFFGHGMSWKSTTFREWTGKKVQCWKTNRQVRKPVNSSKQVNTTTDFMHKCENTLNILFWQYFENNCLTQVMENSVNITAKLHQYLSWHSIEISAKSQVTNFLISSCELTLDRLLTDCWSSVHGVLTEYRSGWDWGC